MPAAPLNADSLARAPKVLLHDHLDGGLRPRTVLELAEEVGYRDLPADEPEALGRWFRESADSGSLERYLLTFAHTVAVMQRPEAVQRVARECALDLAADGVVYAEVRMAPELLTAGGMSLDDAVEAMLDGYAQGSREAAAAGHPILVGALLCAMRQADRWVEVAEQVVRHRDAGVVGFDLAGPEDGFPPDRIPAAIELLDRAGAHRTVHAGEAAGIESIRAALDGAGAERLGHGVRIADEVPADGPLGELAERVREEQVPLEVAPSSNVQTGAYPTLADHPVDRLHRAGFTVTLNTDNRLMSGVSATSELAAVVDTFGWGWDDVQTVAERALRGGFADDAVRARVFTEVLRPGFEALRS
ncbi:MULTISPECIES: adenosine deaminase [unclassified Modestobacter]|uniref:adenosine deaminase n=1 Tax=unclassified Modestobacter TaxID=2643866 RepID=UPI0022AAFBE3|nr:MULTISPECIES: adenosine deaminase [unclassified Modestobacter]MCZ2823721.1 adenosine deaminase [Modestobacter sp. VKM Ac-2981]MCZ2851966.1 adenosine deaminase [Modestobacter sp. VKM Ac-2982]